MAEPYCQSRRNRSNPQINSTSTPNPEPLAARFANEVLNYETTPRLKLCQLLKSTSNVWVAKCVHQKMILPFSEGVCEEDEVKPVVFSSTEGKEKKRKALTKTPSVKSVFQEAMERKVR